VNVFDASALLTFLQGGRGATEVEEALARKDPSQAARPAVQLINHLVRDNSRGLALIHPDDTRRAATLARPALR
jgi:uncharacterized protein with PIN domain